MVISRHRLPHPYRLGLTGLWLLPIGVLLLALLLGNGLSPALLDPRLLLAFGLMAIPALYIWHEGIDILPHGLVTRIHWPRYHAYDTLDNWYYDGRAGRRVLTIWGQGGRKVLECRAGHLTDFPSLLAALKANLRYRNWPT
ncbi:MAG: hypothetical protein HZC41_16590 [Chloroflexi bacterium]|nr:hypothetical protein [Chloroflexota bacterium]